MRILPIPYPNEALYHPDLLQTAEILSQVTNKMDFDRNLGLNFPGLLISPYYTVTINGTKVPVYGTPVFTEEIFGGVLHSFSKVEIDETDCTAPQEAHTSMEIVISSSVLSLNDATVITLDGKTEITADAGNIVFWTNNCGTYTFLINGMSQQFAYILTLVPYVDEEMELAALKKDNPQNLTVFEAGLHYIEPTCIIGQTNVVWYLKKGALLVASHTPRYRDDYVGYRRENFPEEDDGISGMGIGLPRKAVLGVSGVDGLTIAGHGTIDLSMLDLGERSGIVITGSRNVRIRDITLLHSCGWTITLYNDEDVVISGVTTMSWRVGSDSFDVCNCRNVQIHDCFSRCGDDSYVIKAFPGAPDSICRDVLVSHCLAWVGKARGFSVASEVYKDIRNITFQDNTVIAHDATWDNDYVAALAVLIDTVSPDNSRTTVENILFDHITVWIETGRPMLANIYRSDLNGIAMQVRFRHITIASDSAPQKSKLSAKHSGNTVSVQLEEVTVGGTKLSAENQDNYWEDDNGMNTELYFSSNT